MQRANEWPEVRQLLFYIKRASLMAKSARQRRFCGNAEQIPAVAPESEAAFFLNPSHVKVKNGCRQLEYTS